MNHGHRHGKQCSPPPVPVPILQKFIVDVQSDIVVSSQDEPSFMTSRIIQWEVEAENAGLAAYSYWTGKVIGWKKIS